jgi:hypothetical protein
MPTPAHLEWFQRSWCGLQHHPGYAWCELAASASGLGSTGGDLGYGGVNHSVGIELDTFDNGNPDGNSSNHAAIDENGNIINGNALSDQDLTWACRGE